MEILGALFDILFIVAVTLFIKMKIDDFKKKDP